MGNLTRDPQLKYLPSQTAVAEFGLALQPQVPHRSRRGPRRGHVRRLHRVRQDRRADQPVLHQGQADLHRGPAEVRPLGRQARRRQAEQADRRRRQLPVHRRPRRWRRRRWWRWRRRDGDAGDGGGGGGGGGTTPPAAARPRSSRGPQPRPAAAAGRPAAQQAEPPFGDEQQFKDDDIPF